MNRRELMLALAGALLHARSTALAAGRCPMQPAGKCPPESGVIAGLRAALADIDRNGKGEILLPEGRYVLRSATGKAAGLNIPSGTKISGAGRDKTTLVMGENEFGHVINAPFGNFALSDLTVDGNRHNREGQRGHNVRFEGSNIRLERVRTIASVDYAVAVGQRRYANNVSISDLDIEDAGADGIDIKNRLSRTAVRMERVTVKGHGAGRPPGSAGWNKAAIDLRGRCEVSETRIIGIPFGCAGLRFRPGESGVGNGPGAHGATARGVAIESVAGDGVGISVAADDVSVRDVRIAGTEVALAARGRNLSVQHGEICNPGKAAVAVFASTGSSVQRFANMRFSNPKLFMHQGSAAVVLDACEFMDCGSNRERLLDSLENMTLNNCVFDSSCAAKG